MKKIISLFVCCMLLTALLPACAEEAAVMTEVPAYSSALAHRALPDAEAAVAYAKEIWAMDYLAAGDLSGAAWSARLTDAGHWLVTAAVGGNASALYLDMTGEGRVCALMNRLSGWNAAEDLTDVYDPDREAALTGWREQISFMTERFAETLNPGDTDAYRAAHPDGHATGNSYTFYHCMMRCGDEEFLCSYTELLPLSGTKNKYIIQTAPVVRVVYFDSYTDAAEGGNG